MTNGTVYLAGWTMDDIPWDRFDSTKVDPGLLCAVKAAQNRLKYADYAYDDTNITAGE